MMIQKGDAKRKMRQRYKEKLSATLAENSSTELTVGLRH
jgi:hypothetical protein